jgi:predicted DNA binding CopG/RHH family protein
MTVKKKVIKPSMNYQNDIESVINRGGKVSADSNQQTIDEEIRFTLRIPQNLITKVDKHRKSKVGNVSRNQWILETISEKLN